MTPTCMQRFVLVASRIRWLKVSWNINESMLLCSKYNLNPLVLKLQNFCTISIILQRMKAPPYWTSEREENNPFVESIYWISEHEKNAFLPRHLLVTIWNMHMGISVSTRFVILLSNSFCHEDHHYWKKKPEQSLVTFGCLLTTAFDSSSISRLKNIIIRWLCRGIRCQI